jgi:hypothetical protein
MGLNERSYLRRRIKFRLQLEVGDIQLEVPRRVREALLVSSLLDSVDCSVDLSRMRKVRADPNKKLLFTQGGALISDLDEAAAEYGLATGSFLEEKLLI